MKVLVRTLYGLALWAILAGLWDHSWRLILAGIAVAVIWPLISSDVEDVSPRKGNGIILGWLIALVITIAPHPHHSGGIRQASSPAPNIAAGREKQPLLIQSGCGRVAIQHSPDSVSAASSLLRSIVTMLTAWTTTVSSCSAPHATSDITSVARPSRAGFAGKRRSLSGMGGAMLAPPTGTTMAMNAPSISQQDSESLVKIKAYRGSIRKHRSKTWIYQDRAGLPRTPSRYDERRTQSVPFLIWINHRWQHRLARARRLKPQPTIAHQALWLCIHSREGAWNDEGAPYYGGLQMSYGWDGLVSDAARLSPSEQMWAAETGYRRSGYSRSWLLGQWPNTSPPCLMYA